MDKKEISRILGEAATMLELKDADFFKVRAYRSASRALETSDIEITRETRVSDLVNIKGIGKSIAAHISEIIKSGTYEEYQKLRTSTPPGLLEMLKIPGMGAKKVKYLYDNLDISDISALEQACMENSLAGLPGFGEKTQDNILRGIHSIKKYRERYLYAEVICQAEAILANIQNSRYVQKASLGGSLRRKKEMVKDIDIVASTDRPEKVMELFTGLDDVVEVIARGTTKSSIRLAGGINADIRTVEEWQFPYALHHFTGSREHNTAMRSMARRSGIKMNEYGLFKNEKLVPCRSERDIFRVFGMQYIPPELRENRGEIEAAKKGELPALVEESDIKGIIHIHTDTSDGKMTLEQTAAEAVKMGMEYIGISEHSRSAWYAGGLRDEDIEAHLEALEKLDRISGGLKIFRGIESDILNDGSLDYDDRILEKFDFVIIAVHSNFNMTRKDMTRRITRAMENRHSTMLAHPTGRLLLSRDPYEVDMEEVIDAASENDVDLEINSSPFRLDLDWRHARYAREKGVKIFINPDAHNLESLYDYRFGINTARKGWLEKDDIVNTLDADRMSRYLAGKKRKMKGK